ncbi:cytochrome c oxidase subunit 4 isoform 1, mitochondrial-like [Clavelina lepadiformis]|uniref:cytochrome c oxidase subunit 4 isoform 1, mitochondrial-like n=1 Tax=Clavelina lepadiformis TaxID=159417 RepID=UPI0040413E1B
MASSLLRVAFYRVALRRPLHVTAVNGIYSYHPPRVGEDPNINMDFHESLITPLPVFPRTIGFEGELKTLKEKEKGDWKSLSAEEQMDLYNMYFSMSMADMCREKDDWKSVLGVVSLVVAFSLWLHYFLHTQLLQPYPESCTNPEWAHEVIKKQIQFRANPITGYASMWDYENNCWKK